MTTHRITRSDLDAILARYARACDELGIGPEPGYHLNLSTGSATNGIAYRLNVIGDCVQTPDGPTWPNGSGHARPPAGDDFLGFTKREAFDRLADRCSVLEDVAYNQQRSNR